MELGTEEHRKAIEKAVRGKNHLVHKMYYYQCEACGTIERVYLGYGVEGPEELRERDLWIASPFTITCYSCLGGTMQHIAWSSDVTFDRLVIPPYGKRYFCIPDEGIHQEYFQSSVFCGELKS